MTGLIVTLGAAIAVAIALALAGCFCGRLVFVPAVVRALDFEPTLISELTRRARYSGGFLRSFSNDILIFKSYAAVVARAGFRLSRGHLRLERVKHRQQAHRMLNLWGALLPERINQEELGNYLEDINKRAARGERWGLAIRVIAAIFWTSVAAVGYLAENVGKVLSAR